MSNLSHPHDKSLVATSRDRCELGISSLYQLKCSKWSWLSTWILWIGCIPQNDQSSVLIVQDEKVAQPAGRFVSRAGTLLSERVNVEQPLNKLNDASEPMQSSQSRVERLFGSTDRRPPVLEVEMHDRTEHGVPIGLFSDKTLLMRRDGSIDFLDTNRIIDQRILSQRFESIDRNELAKSLYQEFGRRYAIKFEAPYLVVAHAAQLPQWTCRFRSLFHSFRLYCKTHGLALRDIEFPLVAIVLSSHNEFLHYAESEGTKLPNHCVGFYSQKSNRIVLFESPDGLAQDTLETICHEATHQLVFNTGLHQRLAATPLWLAEGFATMFESSRLSGLQQRDGGSQWPESRRHDWQYLAKNPENVYRLLDSLTRNDTAFEREALNAYCASWALTAYLSQRRAIAFGEYLQRISGMPPFEKYDPSRRQADFHAAFGRDMRLLTKNVTAFIDSLD